MTLLAFDPDKSDVINSAYVSTTLVIGTTEVELKVGASPLSERQEILLFNESTVTLFFGPTGVTTSTGIPIDSQETVNLPMGEAISVFIIAGTAGNTIRIQELA